MITANRAYSVSFTGATNTIAGNTRFLNTDSVSLGLSDSSQITFTGGVATTGNGSNPSLVNLAGEVHTTNAPITLGAATLTANTTLNSHGGAMSFGTITYNSFTLTML